VWWHHWLGRYTLLNPHQALLRPAISRLGALLTAGNLYDLFATSHSVNLACNCSGPVALSNTKHFQLYCRLSTSSASLKPSRWCDFLCLRVASPWAPHDYSFDGSSKLTFRWLRNHATWQLLGTQPQDYVECRPTKTAVSGMFLAPSIFGA
jgi:hypothetical protein